MGETVVATALAGLFIIWGLCTILVHFPRFSETIRVLDFFVVIPEWRFFAPNPGRGDFFLLYRDQLADETITDWREIEIVRERALWSGLWNPRRREAKALFDACVELSKTKRDAPDSVLASIPYLTLLTYVSTQPRWSSSTLHTQFLVMMQDNDQPDREVKPLYLSEFHSL